MAVRGDFSCPSAGSFSDRLWGVWRVRRQWDYLDSLELDVACLQETLPPPADRLATYVPAVERGWGTAVVAWPGTELLPPRVQEHPTLPGTGVVANVAKPGSAVVTVISAYGLLQRRANGVTYAVPSVHRLLNDLTATLDMHRSHHPVVLAGDLNVSPQIPEPDREAHVAVIDRIKAFDLIDCLVPRQATFARIEMSRSSSSSV